MTTRDEYEALPPCGKFRFQRDPATKGGLLIVSDDPSFRNETWNFVNPDDLDRYMRNSLFVFQFGAYGDTRVLVWEQGDHIDSALEEAAGWLADFAPGLLSDLKEEYEDALKEAREELGEDADESELQEKAQEIAETDMTYTESGYLTSHEWYVDEVTSGPLYAAALYASRAFDAASRNSYDMIPVLPLGKGEGERVELEEADILKMYEDGDLGLTQQDIARITDAEEGAVIDLKGFKLERVG